MPHVRGEQDEFADLRFNNMLRLQWWRALEVGFAKFDPATLVSWCCVMGAGLQFLRQVDIIG